MTAGQVRPFFDKFVYIKHRGNSTPRYIAYPIEFRSGDKSFLTVLKRDPDNEVDWIQYTTSISSIEKMSSEVRGDDLLMAKLETELDG